MISSKMQVSGVATTRINSCWLPTECKIMFRYDHKSAVASFLAILSFSLEHRYTVKIYSFEWSLPMFLHTTYPRPPGEGPGVSNLLTRTEIIPDGACLSNI